AHRHCTASRMTDARDNVWNVRETGKDVVVLQVSGHRFILASESVGRVASPKGWENGRTMPAGRIAAGVKVPPYRGRETLAGEPEVIMASRSRARGKWPRCQ